MTKWTERAGSVREAVVENWTGERQRERHTQRPEPQVCLFTEKVNDGLTEENSQLKLRTTTFVDTKTDAFSNLLFYSFYISAGLFPAVDQIYQKDQKDLTKLQLDLKR